MSNPIIDILSEDRDLITYRKSLRGIAKSVTGTILLQQMIFRSKGRDKFYKFKSPCDHKLYKDGDSWTEELGFSIKEFDNAIKKIGTKITTKVKRGDVLNKTDSTGIILYWTDRDRVTWYELNNGHLGKLLNGIYLNDQRSYSNDTKGYLHVVPETTTETTTEFLQNSQNGKMEKHIEVTEEREALNALAEAIATLCGVSLCAVTSETARSAIKDLTLVLHDFEVIPDDVQSFSEWWNGDNGPWQAKGGKEPPTPKQVRDMWGRFEASKQPQHNDSPGPRFQNEQQKEIAKQMQAEHEAGLL